MNGPVYSPQKCIILIGCMGCGKSTIGQLLHVETGLPFIDTDHFIEEKEKMSVSEIFSQKGEDYFRGQETAVLKALEADSPPEGIIISTGGGIILRPENRELLSRLGFVVWLNVDAETIFQRISRNRERPLLRTPNPLETLKSIMQARRELYRQTAHLVIETAPLTIQEVAFGIIESARHYFSQRENTSRESPF